MAYTISLVYYLNLYFNPVNCNNGKICKKAQFYQNDTFSLYYIACSFEEGWATL